MLSRLILSGAIALAVSGPAMAQGPDWLEQCEGGALAEVACVGAVAERCMIEDGERTTFMAGPCFGEETALWQARLDAAMAAMAAPAAVAEEWAGEVGWPDPQPSLEQVRAAFERYLEAACDLQGALWGNGSSAGEAWAECRMQVTAHHALRLEDWVEVTR
jgi:hypothetical protein